MKKYILLIIAALLLASCAKNEVVGSKKQRTIDFDAYVGKSPVAKGEDHTSVADIARFGMTVLYKNADGSNLGTTYSMTFDALMQQGNVCQSLAVYISDGVVTPSSPLHWPDDDDQIVQFFAMWPDPGNYPESAHPYVLPVAYSIAEQSDYLFARNYACFRTNGNKPIVLPFEHVMSKVNFTATLSSQLAAVGASIEVKKLTIGLAEDDAVNNLQADNFKNKVAVDLNTHVDRPITSTVFTSRYYPADYYTHDGNPINKAVPHNPWVLSSDPYESDEPDVRYDWNITPGETITLTTGDYANMFVAPETIDLPVSVEYTVKYADGVPDTYTYSKPAVIHLEMKKGHSYVINLTLSADRYPVKFEITEDNMDWPDDENI